MLVLAQGRNVWCSRFILSWGLGRNRRNGWNKRTNQLPPAPDDTLRCRPFLFFYFFSSASDKSHHVTDHREGVNATHPSRRRTNKRSRIRGRPLHYSKASLSSADGTRVYSYRISILRSPSSHHHCFLSANYIPGPVHPRHQFIVSGLLIFKIPVGTCVLFDCFLLYYYYYFTPTHTHTRYDPYTV